MLALLSCAGGCREPEKAQRWQTWEYKDSDVLDTGQQFDAQWARQGDPSSMQPLDPLSDNPLENAMTEKQRRALQESYARQMRQQVDEQTLGQAEMRRRAEEARRHIEQSQSER